MVNRFVGSAVQALLCFVLAFVALAQLPTVSLADVASTETMITATPNPSALGETVTFTATVTSLGGGAPTGTVIFNNGATDISSGGVAVTTIGVGRAIAAGSEHTCAVTAAGGVKCWGWNGNGGLGDGTTTNRATPVDVPGLANIRAVTAGFGHACALNATGGVKCWGMNSSGQLGDGNTTSTQVTVVDVVGLGSGVRAIAAGSGHTCALMNTGGVKCWGDNTNGRLGDGTVVEKHSPVDVSGLASGVIAIGAGTQHTCALTAAGGVKCWGYNGDKQAGNETFEDQLTPVAITGVTSGVTEIAVGGYHICALINTGGVKCWGANFFRQLGDGTTDSTHVPTDVVGLTSGVSAIAAGGTSSCAITTAGALKCWGTNSRGQLGNGDDLTTTVVVDVVGLGSGVSAMAVGGDGSGGSDTHSHACALTSAGALKCWGSSFRAQLGEGTEDASSHPTPLDVTDFGAGGAIVLGRAVFATTALATGAHSITADYSGNGANAASTSGALTQTVNGAATTTVVVSSQNPSVFEQQVTFTATVSSGAGTPGGTVTFKDGGTTIGSDTLSGGGVGSVDISSLAVGAHTITAVYGASGNFAASTSSNLTQTVNKGATTTTVAAAPNPSTPGQTVVLTATVVVTAPAAGVLTGTVAFKDGATTLATRTLSGGSATFNANGLAIGSHPITAVYNTSTNFAASTSSAVNAIVSPNLGAEFRINSNNSNVAILKQAPAVAAYLNGHVVVWESKGQDGSGLGIYGQRYDHAGAKVAGEFKVNTFTAGDQQEPAVTALKNGFLVVWSSNGQDGSGFGIYGQRYSNTGAKVAGEFRVNTTTAMNQWLPSTTGLIDGGFMVTWASAGQDGAGFGIYAQRYNSAGVAVGGEFKVNTTTAKDQTAPSIALQQDGSVVIVWSSSDVTANGFDIRGQRFTKTAVKAGVEFRVNTVTAKHQFDPAVAGLNGGGFMATWISEGQDGSGLGIYGQRFNNAGAKLGPAIKINTTTSNHQLEPAVAALIGGGLAVVWTSVSQDGDGKGVFGQAYDSSVVPAFKEFRVNTSTAKDQWQPRIAASLTDTFFVVWTGIDPITLRQGIYGQRLKLGGL